MRKQTPTGARKMIHVVIRIITTDTDVKKSSSGRPSSPLAAIAIPVTMLMGEHCYRVTRQVDYQLLLTSN